jgi:DNA-binding XRE family transcriptional regulator
MEFGKLFKDVRKQLGKTQTEMAPIIGMSQAAVSKIENDILEPGACAFVNLFHQASLFSDTAVERFNEFYRNGK